MNNVIDIKQLQNKTLEILVRFDEVCKKYSIKYYLAYGTALGAVRHQGFIPWDDDIDVMMFREEYEKFKKVSDELGEKFFLQSRESDKEYPLDLPKIRMNGTAFVEKPLKKYNINHGIYIDVFILEYALENKVLDKATQFIYMLNRFNNTGNSFSSLKGKVLFMCLKPLLNGEKLKNAWNKVIYSNMKKNYSKCNDIFSYGYFFDTKDIGVGKYIKFENRKFLVPENVDNYLTQCYGDYMILPKLEDRIPHHEVDFFSLDKEYVYKKQNGEI